MEPQRVRSLAATWAATWQRCWESADVDSIVALYAAQAHFSSEPFRKVYQTREGVRDYVEGAFADESDVRAWFGEPVVEGDRAAVEWWAAMVESGAERTLAGTSVLRFDADGLVTEQRDTWNMGDGRREPPPEWGR